MAFDPVTERELPSNEVTHLHLFRHGQVETGGRRLAYGHADLPLSMRGVAQGDALVRFAASHLPRPDGVISSDLARCRHVGQAMADQFQVDLRIVPALREQSMGAWEGQAWSDLNAADPPGVHAFWDDYVQSTPPDGESFGHLAERVEHWWHEALPRLCGGRWYVVTHLGVIRALVCLRMGIDLSDALRLAPVRASHTHLMVAEAGSVLGVLGERPSTLSDTTSEALHRPPRIALSGSAGTGKSTLARLLASDFDVPYIEEGMRVRLEAGLDLHTLGPTALEDLLIELWEEQRTLEDDAISAHGGFVADRSAVDFAAFWLHYRMLGDRARTTEVFHQTLRRVSVYDRIVLLPWGVLRLVADGVRSSNPWIQRQFQATLEGLLFREVPTQHLLVLPRLVPLSDRVDWIAARVR